MEGAAVDVIENAASQHLDACARFGLAVSAAGDRWDAPSPCTEWCARDLLEHVIGFHDVLLLRPLGAKPARPRDDPIERWAVTVGALRDVFARPGRFDGVIDVPAIGNNPPTQIDARRIVSMLTQDVVVHTWDLARAVGADDRLDPNVCAELVARLPEGDRLAASGMFAAPVDAPDATDPRELLLTRLGRDPSWTPPR